MNLVPTRHSGPVDRLPSSGAVTPALGQLAQDSALAALIGGNLFGRVAMHPALADVSDEAERGKVLNHAWRRYGTVNSLSLVALVAGWTTTRSDERAPLWTSPRRRSLILAKDIAVASVVVTGLASAASGVGFAHQAQDGAVPMDDGSETASDASAKANRLKHAVNLLGGLNLASEFALVAVNVLLGTSASRRLIAR